MTGNFYTIRIKQCFLGITGQTALTNFKTYDCLQMSSQFNTQHRGELVPQIRWGAIIIHRYEGRESQLSLVVSSLEDGSLPEQVSHIHVSPIKLWFIIITIIGTL